jgi:MFS family permease
MVGATLIGGLVGGPLSDRIGRVRAVAIFLMGFVTIVGLLASVSRTSYSSDVGVLFLLLSIMYVFVGLFTASSYALFMDLTDPRLGATQFSTFMAATNGCESWSVRLGGFVVQRTEYAMGFAAMCLVSLGSLLFLRKLNLQKIPVSSDLDEE